MEVVIGNEAPKVSCVSIAKDFVDHAKKFGFQMGVGNHEKELCGFFFLFRQESDIIRSVLQKDHFSYDKEESFGMQEAEKVVGCTEIQIKGDGILN